MTPQEIEQAVAQIIRKHLGLEYRIFLFGSRATGSARRGSDYDIGVEGEEPLSFATQSRIETDLESLPTLATIEVVDMSMVSDQLARSARLTAKDL